MLAEPHDDGNAVIFDNNLTKIKVKSAGCMCCKFNI